MAGDFQSRVDQGTEQAEVAKRALAKAALLPV